MASFFETVVNVGMTTLFAATAAVRLYQAWREATDEASGAATDNTAGRRRHDGIIFHRSWTFGGGGRGDDDGFFGDGGGTALDDSTPRRVLLTTPSGERMLVLASVDALREMGIVPASASASGSFDGASSAAAAARRRVAAAAASGRELGADDYEALLALDDGLRPARGGGGPVTPELLDALPTHVHKRAKVKKAKNRRPPSSSSSSSASAASPSPSLLAGLAAARRRGDKVDEDEKEKEKEKEEEEERKEEEGEEEGEEESSSSNKDCCSICLQDFADGELVRTLPCLHQYHPGCVDPWLVQKGRAGACCPVCKTAVFR